MAISWYLPYTPIGEVPQSGEVRGVVVLIQFRNQQLDSCVVALSGQRIDGRQEQSADEIAVVLDLVRYHIACNVGVDNEPLAKQHEGRG